VVGPTGLFRDNALGSRPVRREKRSIKTQIETYDTSGTRTLDITAEVRKFAADCGGDGLLHVFAPHATAGIALMETGAGSEKDLEATLERLLPRDDRYVHSHGSPGHGADHLLPAFVAPSLSVPVLEGEPQLGTWQSVVLVDLNRDNPHRKVRLSFIEG
jgi:secondary thiamine-phosphate synthase enzyme